MALSIPIIIGLATFGSYLGKSNRSVKNIRNSVNKESQPSGTNVYHSNRVQEVDLQERKLVDKAFRDSLDPCNTNVVPSFFNTLYNKDCNIQRVAPQNDETLLPQPEEHVDPNNLDSKILEGPMWLNPVPGSNSEQENNTLTGLPLEKSHNNMVPFFGGTVKQNIDLDTHKNILETFTGVGEIIERNKTEVAPMFDTVRENIYGTQSIPNELSIERTYQSNLKTSILPGPQIRVRSVKPEHFPRTNVRNIDETRTLSNPQITYQGRATGAPMGSEQRGIQAPVNKNHGVKTFYTGQERFGPTSSYINGRKMDENFNNLRCTERGQEEIHYGIAGTGARVGNSARICNTNFTEGALRQATNRYNVNPQSTNVMVRNQVPTNHVNIF